MDATAAMYLEEKAAAATATDKTVPVANNNRHDTVAIAIAVSNSS